MRHEYHPQPRIVMEHRDEIDKWLYEEMQLIPGSCSSISALQHNTARMVAEKLWLTTDDIKKILDSYDECLSLTFEKDKPAYESEEFYEEVLRRFREMKDK